MQDKVRVFKVETFGAVDGPGIRLVIFLQGCSFRCKYCHNPESWSVTNNDAKEMTVSDIINLYERNKTFYAKGGITISGGEPMLSAEFIKLLGKKCKEKNIHLAIDTSACNFLENKKLYEEVLDLVNLWIVDIKSLNPQQHKFLTGYEQLTGAEFVKFLEQQHKQYWIRQVIIKSINDDNHHLEQLATFVKSLKYCLRAELLSYHNLAQDKYNKLNINYPFKNIITLTTQEFEQKKQLFNILIV